MFASRKEHTLKGEWLWFKDGVVPKAGLDYFGAALLGEDNLEGLEGEKLLFGGHPHGIYPSAFIALYAGAGPLRMRFPWLRVHPCAASVLFKVPLIREYLLWTGHVDAGRATVDKLMRRGNESLCIVVGGEQEALETRNGKELAVVHGRTGFVKLAIQHGYHLVPTYAFGQNESFTVDVSLFASFRKALQRKFKVSIPVFWGRGGGPMPHKKQITLAIGKPVRVPATTGLEPNAKLVDEIHALYVAELQATFERHKVAAGYGDRVLELGEAWSSAKKVKGQ
ncbi:diacylglycerol acyltransferase [Pelagophyceae sp. CCMP2097]|nr:diacylglycerol acyltransferase [Pelagophyceae sp. CCMP2097]